MARKKRRPRSGHGGVVSKLVQAVSSSRVHPGESFIGVTHTYGGSSNTALATQENDEQEVSLEEGVGLETLPHPEGVSEDVLLEEWLRMRTPRATVYTKNGKRAYRKGSPNLRKAILLDNNDDQFVTAGCRSVKCSEYSSGLFTSEYSRYFAVAGNSNIEDLRNKKASEYALETFKHAASISSSVTMAVNKMFMSIADERNAVAEKNRKSATFSEVMDMREQEVWDLEAIQAAEAMDVTGSIPWDVEPDLVVEDVVNVVETKMDVTPPSNDEEVVQEQVPVSEVASLPSVREQARDCIKMLRYYRKYMHRLELTGAEPKLHSYLLEKYRELKSEYILLGGAHLNKHVSYQYKLRAIANLNRPVKKNEAVSLQSAAITRKVPAPDQYNWAEFRVYEQVERNTRAAKQLIRKLTAGAKATIFGVDFVDTGDLLLPAVTQDVLDELKNEPRILTPFED